MEWFSQKANSANSRLIELSCEIEKIEQRISAIENVSNSKDLDLIRTTIKETDRVSDDPLLKDDEVFTGAADSITEQDCPGLYNDLGVRKFDLHSLWQIVIKQKSLPEFHSMHEQDGAKSGCFIKIL